MNPLFSVIITNYNTAAYLKQRIDTVLDQSCNELEVLILDDGSTDNSKEVLDQYTHDRRIKQIIYKTTNSGTPFPLWREGINMARGEWIWIAESDDFTDPAFLAEIKNVIHDQPDAGIIYTDSFISTGEKITGQFSDERNKYLQTNKWSASYCNNGIDELNEVLKYHNTINNPSCTVFKRALAVRHLNELASIRFYGDWFLWIKILLTSRICYLHLPLSTYRYHEINHSKQARGLASRKGYYRIFKMLYNERSITGKKKLLRYFTDHYFAADLMKKKRELPATLTFFLSKGFTGLKIIARILLLKSSYKFTGKMKKEKVADH